MHTISGAQDQPILLATLAAQQRAVRPRLRFVNTFERDYVCRMDLTDATTVMAELPAAIEHFNNVHQQSNLRMRSPREFRPYQQRYLTGNVVSLNPMRRLVD